MELVFKSLILFTIIQRLFELYVAKRNERFILSQGGEVLKERNYIFMVLLHTFWLVSLVFFTWFLERTFFYPFLFFPCLVFFVTGQFLRLSAIKTLGKRWSTRVVVLPGAPVVSQGIFKYIRHPNYVGVVLEIFSLPLMAGLWVPALAFSLLNGVILFFRIPFEEKMLSHFNDYQEAFLKRESP